MSLGHAALIAAGIALLTVVVAAWRGRWRGWARDLAGGPMVITLAPACGLMLLVLGLAPVLPASLAGPLFVAMLAALLAAFVLFLWQPDWLGPAWYRERDRSALHQDVPLNAAVLSAVKPDLGVAGSETTAMRMFAESTARGRWRAHLVSDDHGRPSAMQRKGLVRGHVLIFPEALVFAADRNEDKMRQEPVIEVLAAERIVSARRWRAGWGADGPMPRRDLPSWVMPRLLLETTDGAWVLECARAGGLLAEIERRYLHHPASDRRHGQRSVGGGPVLDERGRHP